MRRFLKRIFIILFGMTVLFSGAVCRPVPGELTEVLEATPIISPVSTQFDMNGSGFGREDNGVNESTDGPGKSSLPNGFVYIDEIIEDCIVDAKYAGFDNFMGRPVKGYEKPYVICSEEVAEGLVKASDILRGQGYLLIIFDSYRPQRAVEDFIIWAEDLEDQLRKEYHYPNIEKSDLFGKGYIAARSGHTRGAAVDLSLFDIEADGELDMGTCFDFLDELSRHGAKGITSGQEKNREILRQAMIDAGFKAYKKEWWHYAIDPEPYPDTYFDFPVK